MATRDGMISETWGADIPISMPDVLKELPLVYFEGFAFGESGMVHALTEPDRQQMLNPMFGPEMGADTDGIS